ncbi:hypothetical protein UPYG_G00095600 [Umbra pygmaea]|uniref:B30.2/SPRY domain-containing protein n=1 Tax=Umbra pygmaea TaxID=75934 RepID=A0ABD0WZS4_UMBPY
MDANVKIWLLETLEQLGEQEFRKFKWFLQQNDGPTLKRIPKSKLENATRTDTVDEMVQTYCIDGSMEISKTILERINRNDLAESLKNYSADCVDEGAPVNHTEIPTTTRKLKNNLPTSKEDDLKKYFTTEEGLLEMLPLVKTRISVLLAGRGITEKGCAALVLALKSNPSNLEELDLSNNDLKDAGVKMISALLEDPECRLETLRLSGCGITEKGFAALVSALKSNCSNLKELDLSKNDLEDAGVKMISALLEDPQFRLETLRLSGCLVTKEGCASLVSALRLNPSHLKELDLSYNHPGDSGVTLFSAGLKDPTWRLEKLNVDHGGECRLKSGLKKYFCDLTLDPNTANIKLSLSRDNKKVSRTIIKQSYPDHPERFHSYRQVLCREGLTGRCYWEIEWSGREVDIAVSYDRIDRSQGCWFGRNNLSWSLTCDSESYYAYHNNKRTVLPVEPSGSHRVGVYLDWPAGTLSFYRVSINTLTHLYTFNTTFTEPLYPGFYLHADSSVSLCRVCYG